MGCTPRELGERFTAEEYIEMYCMWQQGEL